MNKPRFTLLKIPETLLQEGVKSGKRDKITSHFKQVTLQDPIFYSHF